MIVREDQLGSGGRYLLSVHYDDSTDLLKVALSDSFTKRTTTAFKKLDGRDRLLVEEGLYSVVGLQKRGLAQDLIFDQRVRRAVA